MRVEFVKSVHAILESDPKALFLTGDLGYRALEPIAESLKKRFVNAGVAEQNMMGVAAGMALSGFTPWVYSIASFVTYRCLEQIRNDVCFHNLSVRIVGNGGGYTYGIMGSTHHALEELAALKALPNMQLFFPCENDHVPSAVDQIAQLKGPSYLRLAISGYNTSGVVPLWENPATLTRRYAEGPALTLVGIGHATQIILHAMKHHALGDLPCDVFGLARFPVNLAADRQLIESVKRTGKVLVVEEHYRYGSIAESLKEALPPLEVFEILCPSYSPQQRYGSSKFHLDQCAVTPERIVSLAQEMVSFT